MTGAPLIAAMIAVAESAGAQGLPEVDIEAHCYDVGGGKKRIAACTAGENRDAWWSGHSFTSCNVRASTMRRYIDVCERKAWA